MDARMFRACLGQYATGVAVVTYEGEDGPRGATINSFTSVSMDPPLVLVSFARRTTTARLLPDRPFVVNVLSSNQLDVALQFAGRPQTGLRVPWSPGATVVTLPAIFASRPIRISPATVRSVRVMAASLTSMSPAMVLA